MFSYCRCSRKAGRSDLNVITLVFRNTFAVKLESSYLAVMRVHFCQGNVISNDCALSYHPSVSISIHYYCTVRSSSASLLLILPACRSPSILPSISTPNMERRGGRCPCLPACLTDSTPVAPFSPFHDDFPTHRGYFPILSEQAADFCLLVLIYLV